MARDEREPTEGELAQRALNEGVDPIAAMYVHAKSETYRLTAVARRWRAVALVGWGLALVGCILAAVGGGWF